MNAREAIEALKKLDPETPLWTLYVDSDYGYAWPYGVTGIALDGEVYGYGAMQFPPTRDSQGELIKEDEEV